VAVLARGEERAALSSARRLAARRGSGIEGKSGSAAAASPGGTCAL
jgi:hypothetical protein